MQHQQSEVWVCKAGGGSAGLRAAQQGKVPSGGEPAQQQALHRAGKHAARCTLHAARNTATGPPRHSLAAQEAPHAHAHAREGGADGHVEGLGPGGHAGPAGQSLLHPLLRVGQHKPLGVKPAAPAAAAMRGECLRSRAPGFSLLSVQSQGYTARWGAQSWGTSTGAAVPVGGTSRRRRRQQQGRRHSHALVVQRSRGFAQGLPVLSALLVPRFLQLVQKVLRPGERVDREGGP